MQAWALQVYEQTALMHCSHGHSNSREVANQRARHDQVVETHSTDAGIRDAWQEVSAPPPT